MKRSHPVAHDSPDDMKEELMGIWGYENEIAHEPKNTTSPTPAASIEACTPDFWGNYTMEWNEPKHVFREWWGYRGEPMTVVSLQHIPLTNAYLCQDCSSIGNCAQHCPACASEALMGLSGVLNRPAVEETAHISFTRRPALAA